jgi:hypothetical protein
MTKATWASMPATGSRQLPCRRCQPPATGCAHRHISSCRRHCRHSLVNSVPKSLSRHLEEHLTFTSRCRTASAVTASAAGNAASRWCGPPPSIVPLLRLLSVNEIMPGRSLAPPWCLCRSWTPPRRPARHRHRTLAQP